LSSVFGVGFYAGNGGSAWGGGIYAVSGSLTLNNGTLSSNAAQGGKGGDSGSGFVAFNGGPGFFLPVQGDGGNALGGGFYTSGTATLNNVSVQSNVVQGGAGGAGGNGSTSSALLFGTLHAQGANGGNGGVSEGGGIYVASGTLTLTNCGITANSAIGTSGGAGGTGFINGTPGTGHPSIGGGLYNAAATVVLKNTSVSGNSADIDPDIGP
jgi:hypothetical protein